jgi:serine protease Do
MAVDLGEIVFSHCIVLGVMSLLTVFTADSLLSAGVLLPSDLQYSQERLSFERKNTDIKSFGSSAYEDIVLDPLKVAKQITVRVLTDPGVGSGVIVAHQGTKYTVLTNEHVVSSTWNNRYTVLTADGLIHKAKRLNSNKFSNLDLAIVQFSSSQNYLVAKINKSNPYLLDQKVYASGFPNWYWSNPGSPVSTHDWGLKAYKITTGTVKMVLNPPLLLGYQIGYTNDIKNGMSGGPVIDSNGYLIGINGRLKHPFNGINSYVFTDGSMPSQEQFLQMESLSWAIIPKIFH